MEERNHVGKSITEAEILKESLENLYLYLNEIDKIVNSENENKDIAKEKYKLQQLERYLSEMNSMFEYLNGSMDIDKNKIS